MLAALIYGFVNKLNIFESAKLACKAASKNVQKRGVSPILLEDVKSKIVFTNGVFDILHEGHLSLLKYAKSLGGKLVVAINSDQSVKKNKGNERPINDVNIRKQQLEILPWVDQVMVFKEKTPLNLIRQIRPDIIVKGGDYKKKEVIGNNTHFPIKYCIQKALAFHCEHLKTKDSVGSIFLDSRKEFDSYSIEAYHTFKIKEKRSVSISSGASTAISNGYNYGKEILGINLQTKANPDAGIEICDLISYLAFQHLRGKYNRANELKGISKKRLTLIRKTNRYIYRRKGINKGNETKNCGSKLKELIDKRLAPLLEELARSSSVS